MANKEPKYLYHYTTIEAFKNMIENQTLWLGDYRYLNDINEFEHSAKIAKCYIKKKDSKSDEYSFQNIIEVIDSIKKGECAFYKMDHEAKYVVRDKTKHIGRFILSLTDKEDDKDMWVLYGSGNSGIRLKLNFFELKKYIDTECEQLVKNTSKNAVYCGKVSYNDNDIRKKIDEKVFSLPFQDVVNRQYIIFNILALNKSSQFQNENEYRIIISQPDEEPIRKLKKVYAVKNGYIKPFIELSNLPIKKIISEVMISPYNKSELAKPGLEDFIYHATKAHIEIVPSGIAIR